MKFRLLTISFLILIFKGIYAQDFPIKLYTTQDGLAQMQILSFLKDSRGIIWCGTNFGLSRFNGESFTNFNKSNGLKYVQINNILEDHYGNIWLQAVNKGLIKFNGNKFTYYNFPSSKISYSGFTITDQNQIFVSLDNKLYEFKNNIYKPISTRFLKDSTSNIGLKYFKHKLLIDQNFNIYNIGNSNRIFNKRAVIQYTFKDEFFLNEVDLENGKSYFGLSDGKNYRRFFSISDKNIEVYSESNHDFLIPANGNLYYLKKHSKMPEFVAKNVVPTMSWSFLGQSDSENFWFPSEQGLLKITRKGFRQFSQQEVPYCWSVVEDNNNNFYFLNFRHSLQYYNHSKITEIPRKNFLYDKKEELSLDWYYKAIKDQYNQIWLANSDGVFVKENQKWKLYNLNLPNRLAFTLAEDKLRSKIVAASDQRLFTLNCKKHDELIQIRDNHPMFERLILSLVVSPSNEYWFGGRNIGKYNPNSQKFEYFTNENGKMPAKGVTVLYFDNQKNLYAGTFGDGLYRYNTTKDKFERILAKQFREEINLIEQIDNERLMVGTLKGLYVINLGSIDSINPEIKVFNQHNGYLGIEPGQLGSFKDSKGKIWITSGTVLSVMDPKELDFKKTKLKTFITKINNNLLPFKTSDSTFSLPKDLNSATFTVESVGENKPEKSQFSFRIKGFFDQWTPWQEQNILMVNNIPNGVHNLEVRSRSGNLDYSLCEIQNVKFSVNVPFYKSPNFYKYAFFIGLSLILLSTYALVREFILSKKLILSKSKMAEQENKVKFLQVQTIQAQMNPHFTFNVLGTLQQLILNNETEKANENLLKLSSLIRNYLEASLLGDEETGSLFKHEIPLSKEIELLKLYIEFEQLQYKDKFEYRMEIEGDDNPINYKIPPLILQPFVENAIKHGLLYLDDGVKGELEIKFLLDSDETLTCFIIDNGVGFAKAKEIQSQSIRKYKSRGTELVDKRIKILNEMGYDITLKTTDRGVGGTIVKIVIGYK